MFKKNKDLAVPKIYENSDCTQKSKDSREMEVLFGFGRFHRNSESNSWTQMKWMLAQRTMPQFWLGRGERYEERVLKQVIEE